MRTIKKLKKQENGSIMLEVVAVLALMGVMGAMLFRQIYQRNQELHNIQMASEIRTVKEAFAAYIQANRAAILHSCKAPSSSEDVVGCTTTGEIESSQYDDVAGYLPDGWFAEGELQEAYRLTLWNYMQTDGSERRVIYGIVVPTVGTLPSTGWNFRRAARVALLIGADGGAYDSGITGGDIAGALGSWRIDKEGVITEAECPDIEGCPTYVAMTGIDVFAPEYELPEGEVNLPDPLSLALENLHAYNYFSVGGGNDADCYTVQHNTSVGTPPVVRSDLILPTNCTPLFWVGNDDKSANGTTGNVYVQNDLNVGADMTGTGDHALKLTAEGVIKQKGGLTIDKYGRLFSSDYVAGDLGDLKKGEHYVLDLARTSTMKDIRLASRGGVRLSEILPNYILKEQYDVYCTLKSDLNDNVSVVTGAKLDKTTTDDVSWCDASKTGHSDGSELSFSYSCPTGYKKAVVIIPSYIAVGGNNITKKQHQHDFRVNTKKESTEGEGYTAGDHWHGVEGTTGNAKVDSVDPEFVLDIDECQPFVSVKALENTSNHLTALNETITDKFYVTIGYRYTASSVTIDGKAYNYVCPKISKNSLVHATVQTYCVWEPSFLTEKYACRGAGYKWEDDKCTGEAQAESIIGDLSDAFEVNEALCECLGFEWDDDVTRCIYRPINPASVTALSGKSCAFDSAGTARALTDDDVITVCKMLGYQWTGSACKCPSGTSWNIEWKNCKP